MIERTSVPIHTPGYNKQLLFPKDFDCTNEIFKCYYETARLYYKTAISMVVGKKHYAQGIILLLSPYHQFSKNVREFLRGLKELYDKPAELEDIKLLEDLLVNIDKIYKEMLSKIR